EPRCAPCLRPEPASGPDSLRVRRSPLRRWRKRAENTWKKSTRPKAVSPYAADAVASAALSRAPEGGGLNPRPFQAALDDRAVDVFQRTERIGAFRGVFFRLCQFLADRVKLGIQSSFGLVFQ